MSNTFLPLLKTSLKISFDFRGKKQKYSMLTMLMIILLSGMVLSGFYSFTFVMAAQEMNAPITGVLFAMSGFASLLALTTTIPKVKSSLFGGNDYDMLAAMPIPKKEILFVKFFSLYLVELFYTVIIILPAGIICFIFDNSLVYLLNTLLMLFLVPVFPLLLACLIGTFISVIADRSRFGNVISILFYLVFVVVLFSTSMMTSSGRAEDFTSMFNLFKIFNPTNLLLEIQVTGINYLLYTVVNLVILIAVICFLTLFYDHIHELLSTARSNKVSKKEKELKVNTSFKSLLKLDFKRYFTSKCYLMNTIIGGILSVVMMSVAVFSLLTDETMKEVLDVFRNYLSFLSLGIIFTTGLTTPAASAISMEGKSMWIVKSLPIDYKKYLKSKILLSEIVMAPFALISSIIVAVLIKNDVIGIITVIVLPQLYLLGMNYISLILNTRFYKFDWSNEIEVVKQSKCVLFVMLIDFVYILVLSVFYIGLSILFNLLIGSLVAIILCLIMVIISRHVLYKKGPNRIANVEV